MPPGDRGPRGQRVSLCPTEKEKPNTRTSRGRDVPCSPLGPTLSPPWRLIETSTGTMARWAPKPRGAPGVSSSTDPRGRRRSWLVCGQLPSTGIIPSQGRRRPLTCFKPDTRERLRQAQDQRFPLPGAAAPCSWLVAGESTGLYDIRGTPTPQRRMPCGRARRDQTSPRPRSASPHPAPRPGVAGGGGPR